MRNQVYTKLLIVVAMGVLLISSTNASAHIAESGIRSESTGRAFKMVKQQDKLPAEKRKSNTTNENIWTASEKKLIEGSRDAILKTGMTAGYFDKHFRVVKVVDMAGDRRVIWRININEYETTLSDSIGYYTRGSNRIDVHSVENTLSTTNDITRTISRKRALSIMAHCIGKFASPGIEYRSHLGGRASLLLTAHSLPKSARSRSEVEREREEKAREEVVKSTANNDVIEQEDEGGGRPVVLGFVDLVTGKCVKGIGQAGPAKPQ